MSTGIDIRVARRYARALFAAAARVERTESVQNDLQGLMSLWRSTPGLRRTLESPLVAADSKQALMDRVFGGSIDSLTAHFLHLLIDKRRENVLPVVDEEFRRLADEAQGLVRAHAIVAMPMDDAERTSVIAGLQDRTGKRVEMDVEVSPHILGGIVVRMQDTVIDGSVRGALERLREQMLR